MGAQESTEEAPEGALEDGQSPGAANESKEELTTPTRFRRRSRSEPPDPRAAEALSPAAIDLRLDEARSPANVDPRLRPPARVRASSTLALFPEEAYAESVSAVLCSKFVVVQVILNVVASIVGPIAMFALLFAVLKQGPYDSDGPGLVGVGWGSLIMSPLLIFMMMPVAMPEAVEAGWFKPIRLETCGRWRIFLPFLGTHRCWRWAPARHLCLGGLVGIVYFPSLLLIAHYVMGPTLSTRTLIWFLVCYTAALAPPVTALGCLGYAVEHNLAPTIGMMRPHKNPCIRTLKRAARAVGMYLCPCFDEPAPSPKRREPTHGAPHPHAAIHIRSPARPSDNV